MERIKRFFRDEEGATMVEYAIMVFLIAVVCFAIVGTLGTSISTMFGNIATKI
jgi:pilus assembly protein Flp/PilA